jgi:hypothetical protein
MSITAATAAIFKLFLILSHHQAISRPKAAYKVFFRIMPDSITNLTMLSAHLTAKT